MAVFVLKRDVKLQPTNFKNCTRLTHSYYQKWKRSHMCSI